MKQGRALPEVLTELQRQNAAKQDYIGAAEAFRLDGGRQHIPHWRRSQLRYNIVFSPLGGIGIRYFCEIL